MEALDKQFGVTEAGSTVEAEIRAGVTTFLTMAYILVVNPSMLSLLWCNGNSLWRRTVRDGRGGLRRLRGHGALGKPALRVGTWNGTERVLYVRCGPRYGHTMGCRISRGFS